MGEIGWTNEQLAAINLRGCLLVAAAAGSGKTAVLVERVIRRITDPQEPVDVDSLLVVTFTKAAANEMRQRINKALNNAVFSEYDQAEVDRLIKQLALLTRANITTLHSFCLELLRKYFFSLELDPSFRVADEAECELLRQDTVEEIFEEHYAQEAPDFLRLVDCFGTDRDDHPLMEQVLKLYQFAFSQIEPVQWLQNLVKVYQWEDVEAFMNSPWGIAVTQGINDKVQASIDLLEQALSLAQSPLGPDHYCDVLNDELNQAKTISKYLASGSWTLVEKSILELDFARLTQKRGKKTSKGKEKDSLPSVENLDEELLTVRREETKQLRDEAKKILQKLKEELFSWPLSEQLAYMPKMAGLIQTLSSLVIEFAGKYAEVKHKKNVVDFTDLEHMALRLLQDKEGKPSTIARGLQVRFAEVLVDEYQDINQVQERILQLVSTNSNGVSNLFMVGDVKQSIYRFRMADPSLFLGKYTEFPHWKEGSDSARFTDSSSSIEPGVVVDLARNFRSRQEVVDGVNFLFRQIMTQGAGEISYNDQAALKYGASYISGQEQVVTAEGPIEVHLYDKKEISLKGFSYQSLSDDVKIDTGSNEEMTEAAAESSESSESDSQMLEELESARIEARLVAERIRKMIEGPGNSAFSAKKTEKQPEFYFHDKKLNAFRPVRYSDIVILMRSYAALAPIYVEEFQKVDIPVFAETGTGYFAAGEVETMLSLLKVIDNPRLDIQLCAVLRSPLVGLDGTLLGKLRTILPQGDFYDACVFTVWAGVCDIDRIQKKAAEDGITFVDYIQKSLISEDYPGQGVNSKFLGKEFLIEITQTLSIYRDSWAKLLKSAQEIINDAPGLQEKISAFWVKLQSWRVYSRRNSLADLLWLIYEETGYLAYVGTLSGGTQREANLRALYDRACRFEATQYRGLFRFLRFLDKFREQGKDMGTARALGENEDVVRLQTVHASKGLEYPVVFVVGLGNEFNLRSLNDKVLLHSELGVGIPIFDVDNLVRYPSFVQYAVKQTLKQESLTEELRILYVAFTRAKERLLIYGGLKKLENTLAKWQQSVQRLGEEEALPDPMLRSAKCFLDWIGPSLARHPDLLLGGQDFSEEETANYPVFTGDSAISQASSKWEFILHENVYTFDDQAVQATEQFKEDSFEDRPEDLVQENVIDPYSMTNMDQLMKEVDWRLSWSYPYEGEVRQIAKTSVSELKRRFIWYTEHDEGLAGRGFEPADLTKVQPKFRQIEINKLTAAERGIAYHTIMQHIPVSQWRNLWPQHTSHQKKNLLRELLAELSNSEILTEVQINTIEFKRIVELFDSPLGERLFNQTEILREQPFSLTLKPHGIEQPILVQGVIDALLLDSQTQEAEILDYKTDYISPETDHPVKLLQERYTLQLALYSMAVEKLLKVKVKRCTIYSFALGCEIDLTDVVNDYEFNLEILSKAFA